MSRLHITRRGNGAAWVAVPTSGPFRAGVGYTLGQERTQRVNDRAPRRKGAVTRKQIPGTTELKKSLASCGPEEVHAPSPSSPLPPLDQPKESPPPPPLPPLPPPPPPERPARVKEAVFSCRLSHGDRRFSSYGPTSSAQDAAPAEGAPAAHASGEPRGPKPGALGSKGKKEEKTGSGPLGRCGA